MYVKIWTFNVIKKFRKDKEYHTPIYPISEITRVLIFSLISDYIITNLNITS